MARRRSLADSLARPNSATVHERASKKAKVRRKHSAMRAHARHTERGSQRKHRHAVAYLVCAVPQQRMVHAYYNSTGHSKQHTASSKHPHIIRPLAPARRKPALARSAGNVSAGQASAGKWQRPFLSTDWQLWSGRVCASAEHLPLARARPRVHGVRLSKPLPLLVTAS